MYIVVFVVRPLVFFPATLLSAVSGALFGPVYGVLYTIIGENLSANFTFLIGRYFGEGIARRITSGHPLLARLDCRYRENGFVPVMIMRLVYMPFDLVGFLAGACGGRQRDFALGTFIGILPGLLTFVLLGSAVTDPVNLALALVFFVLGLVISNRLKKRNA